MSRTIWVGAVAYDPKVVTIWEGMRRYFHEEARLPVEVVLFQSYEMQVAALLAEPAEPLPRIDNSVEHHSSLSASRLLEQSTLPADCDARYRPWLEDDNRHGERRTGFQTV